MVVRFWERGGGRGSLPPVEGLGVLSVADAIVW